MELQTSEYRQGHRQAVEELYNYIHVARSWDRADEKPGEAAQVVPPRRLETIDPSSHTWIMMRRSYDLLCHYYSRTDRCQPIVFNMFLGEYYFPRGLQELQENFVSCRPTWSRTAQVTNLNDSLSTLIESTISGRHAYTTCGQRWLV